MRIVDDALALRELAQRLRRFSRLLHHGRRRRERRCGEGQTPRNCEIRRKLPLSPQAMQKRLVEQVTPSNSVQIVTGAPGRTATSAGPSGSASKGLSTAPRLRIDAARCRGHRRRFAFHRHRCPAHRFGFESNRPRSAAHRPGLKSNPAGWRAHRSGAVCPTEGSRVPRNPSPARVDALQSFRNGAREVELMLGPKLDGLVRRASPCNFH